jgi:hypothetical protein
VSVLFPVTELQERVRIRCGLNAYSSESNITTAMILTILQESIRDLSAIVGDFDWYFVTTSDVVTVANNPLVALPVNFATLQRVSWKKSAAEVIPLEAANLEDVHAPVAGDTWTARTPKYRLTQQSLEFFPTPTAVHTVEVRCSTGQFITSSADNFVGHLGWDTWVVYNACCIVAQRQEKEYSAFSVERDRKLAEILRSVKRDKTGVAQPRDVRGTAESDPAGEWWRL